MIYKRNHSVRASRVNRARNPQFMKLQRLKSWLKQPKNKRGKYPPRKAGERNG